MGLAKSSSKVKIVLTGSSARLSFEQLIQPLKEGLRMELELTNREMKSAIRRAMSDLTSTIFLFETRSGRFADDDDKLTLGASILGTTMTLQHLREEAHKRGVQFPAWPNEERAVQITNETIEYGKQGSAKEKQVKQESPKAPGVNRELVNAIREYCEVTGVSEVDCVNEALEVFVDCSIGPRLESFFAKRFGTAVTSPVDYVRNMTHIN